MNDRTFIGQTSVVCAIAGGSGAGKTTLANAVSSMIADSVRIEIDWYYRDLSQMSPRERDLVNFDHPDSLELDLFCHHLAELRAGRSIQAPTYDFATHTRPSLTQRVESAGVIVTEGIHLLAIAEVRANADILVFVEANNDLRLERRIRRDVAERGRTPESVIAQWQATVAPMHEQFVEPSRDFADIVVAETEDIHEAAKVVVAEIGSIQQRLVATAG